ncbi:hypothetical protein [Streptomyces sp. NPDC005302]|uniref:hypothetical protein n=1 Tax=Streptomyces sp. NPDC005302 TaxID=3154675 RepID=UPI0033B2C392
MTDPKPLDTDQLDDIAARAAHLHKYGALTDAPLQEDLDRLTGVEVPALLAEIALLHNDPPMRCICCDMAVGWVDAPTGGWWAHETHPEDGHDAEPRPASR